MTLQSIFKANYPILLPNHPVHNLYGFTATLIQEGLLYSLTFL